jgi:putative oxidoreductase
MAGKKARTPGHGGRRKARPKMPPPFLEGTSTMREFIATRASRLLDALHAGRWLGPLVLRLVFGYFWLETGLAKVQHVDGFAERFAGWGIPFPMLSATLSAWTDLVGGALLMLGLLTRVVCVPMLVNMAVALIVVVSRDLTGLDDYVETSELTYILIFFWLIMAGPGKASLDTLLARRLGIRTRD